ncbi:putative ankyrin repeat protein RBE_0220 [Saccostrea echinata]|uniref:putative ankyrin repeat protein RBE_0220 n=1 Tax=Saccostrea echinata TaxID=191078 RepID=UPI002A82CB69|nr:putative ankyrin repeat protein RBE_0220 [Saccostrea echinata]
MLSNDSKLLMTSRTVVEREAERFGLHSAILENVFNLDDEKNHLTSNDRMEILSCHLKESSSFSKLKEYVEGTDKIIMFPLLCKLISSNSAYERESYQFFKEPCQLILKYLQELEKTKRIHYASLVICMLNKGKISKEDIEEKPWIKSVLHKCCRVPTSTEIWEFPDALSDMIGTYVTKTPDGFVFVHDIYFEVIVYYFGTQYPEEIIERLASELISDKLVLQENEKISDLQIHIKQNMFPRLARRLIKELKDLKLYVVFDSKFLHNTELQNYFLEYLKQDFSYKDIKEIFLKPTDKFNSSLLLQVPGDMKCINELTNIDFLARALIENAQTMTIDDSSEDEDEYKSEMLIKPKVKQVIPLSWAVAYGHSFLLQYLVGTMKAHDSTNILGFDNEEQSRYLVLACYSKCADTVNFVLRHVSDDCVNLPPIKRESERQDVPIHYNFTPLKMAILRGSSKIVQILIKANVDINAMDFAGITPIWTAINASQHSIFNELISRKADVNTFGKGILSPLILAARLNKSEVLDTLLKNGADCNYRSTSRETALYWASRVGNFKSVKQLIEYKADVSLYVDGDKSPFCIAAKNGSRAILELLFSNGAKCNLLDENGCPPIYLASYAGHAEIVKFLLEKRADININMYNPLLAAITNRYADIAIMLIQAGANRNEHNTSRGFTTPLHEAVKENMADIIQVLHGHNLNYRAQNDEYITPLEAAIWMGRKEIVHLLIKGENSIKNGSGNEHLFEAMTKLRSSNLRLNHKDEIEAEDKDEILIVSTSSLFYDVLAYDTYSSLDSLLSLGLRGDRFLIKPRLREDYWYISLLGRQELSKYGNYLTHYIIENRDSSCIKSIVDHNFQTKPKTEYQRKPFVKSQTKFNSDWDFWDFLDQFDEITQIAHTDCYMNHIMDNTQSMLHFILRSIHSTETLIRYSLVEDESDYRMDIENLKSTLRLYIKPRMRRHSFP